MKKQLMILLPILILSGCTSSVSYDVQRFTMVSGSELEIIDKRTEKDKEYFEGCKMLREPVDNIGDKNLKPSKIALLKSALIKKGFKNGKVEVSKFNLKLIYPRMCGVGRGATLAATSVPLDIISQNGSGDTEDGVICELTIRIQGKTVNGYSYIPAGEGIRTLFGATVSSKGLEKPLSDATEKCVEYAVQSF